MSGVSWMCPVSQTCQHAHVLGLALFLGNQQYSVGNRA